MFTHIIRITKSLCHYCPFQVAPSSIWSWSSWGSVAISCATLIQLMFTHVNASTTLWIIHFNVIWIYRKTSYLYTLCTILSLDTLSDTNTGFGTDSSHSLLFSTTSDSTKHRSKTYNTKNTVNKIRLVWSIFIISLVKRMFRWIFVSISCNFYISNHPLRASAFHVSLLAIWTFIFRYSFAAWREYSVFQVWANSVSTQQTGDVDPCCCNVGPPSQKMDQHYINIVCISWIAGPLKILILQAGTSSRLNVGQPLFHRLRRWSNVKSTLIQLFVPAWLFRNEPLFPANSTR